MGFLSSDKHPLLNPYLVYIFPRWHALVEYGFLDEEKMIKSIQDKAWDINGFKMSFTAR